MATDRDAVVVGVAGSVFPVNAAQPIHAALNAAINALPSGGGDIHVLPSASPYGFTSTVDITKADVTIHFAPGAILGFGASLQALVRVRARGFQCVGAHVVHQVQDSDSNHSCFLVEDSVPGDSNDAAFVACRFDMKQLEAAILGFSCIRAKGSSATEPRRGLLVDGATFFMRVGVPQTLAWQGPSFVEPYGICGIRAENSAECILTTNRFDGELQSEDVGGNCGPMVYLSDSPDSVFDGNLCRNLFLVPASIGTTPDKTSTLIRLTNQSVEGHQSILARSVVENVGSTYIFEFLDLHQVIVASSNFGRLVRGTMVGIRAASKFTTGIGGNGLTLYANNYHNIGGFQGHLIQVDSTRDVTISNGVLSLLKLAQLPIRIGPGPCTNVVIEPGQPRMLD